MNISSIIVYTNNFDKTIEDLDKIEKCEIGLANKEKQIIIAVIEAENVQAEMEVLSQIQALEEVIEANMHFSYAQDEIQEAMENISTEVPNILSDEVSIDEVRYSGSVYNQMHKS